MLFGNKENKNRAVNGETTRFDTTWVRSRLYCGYY